MPSFLKATYLEIKKTLSDNDIAAFDVEARIIIEERTKFSVSDLIVNPDSIITDNELSLIRDDLKMRLSGKPLSRIYGMNEFWGLPFIVNEHVLDPRGDTETIIERALPLFDKDKEIRILDMGTGSGCLIISLLHEFPNAIGVATDLSEDALVIAKKNAALNNVEGRISFFCGSWFEGVAGEFDLIVSNPPYIRADVIPFLSDEVKNHDPILALDGGDDGLSPYRDIFYQLKNYLKSDGTALFEIGYDQKKCITRLSETAGLVQRAVHIDSAGNPRVVEISCGDK